MSDNVEYVFDMEDEELFEALVKVLVKSVGIGPANNTKHIIKGKIQRAYLKGWNDGAKYAIDKLKPKVLEGDES